LFLRTIFSEEAQPAKARGVSEKTDVKERGRFLPFLLSGVKRIMQKK